MYQSLQISPSLHRHTSHRTHRRTCRRTRSRRTNRQRQRRKPRSLLTNPIKHPSNERPTAPLGSTALGHARLDRSPHAGVAAEAISGGLDGRSVEAEGQGALEVVEVEVWEAFAGATAGGGRDLASCVGCGCASCSWEGAFEVFGPCGC